MPRPAVDPPDATTAGIPAEGTPAVRDLLIAFGSGGLLTLMVMFNGQLAAAGTPLFASWAAHGTGSLAALVLIAALRRRKMHPGPALSMTAVRAGGAPLWAYLGGLSGALTVMLTSATVNTALALSGTLALGLVGQTLFGLAADAFGWFGLARRRPGAREIGALALVLAGSALVLFSGRG